MNATINWGGLAERTGPAFERTADHPESLAQYVVKLVEMNRDGEFIAIDRYGRRHSATYGEMLERACAIMGQLPKSSAQEHYLAVLCFNSILDYIGCAWACLLKRIDILPLDTAAAFANPIGFNQNLTDLINELGSGSLVLADSEICGAIERSAEGLAAKVINVSGARACGLDKRFGELSVESRASNLLISTSGTGGAAKIAVLDNYSLTNRFFDGLRQDPRVCLYNLAHHSVAGVRLLLPVGQRVVHFHPLRLAADPRDWFRAIEEFSVTDLGVSSSIAAILCAAVGESAPDFSVASLERLSFGAEFIVPHVVKQFLLALNAHGAGETLVSLVYSMTETGPIYRSILPSSELLKQLEAGTEAIALDDCVSGWSVRCIDDFGRVVRQGEPGTIQVRSENKLFAGYFTERGTQLPVRSTDKWFSTGDVAIMSDGKLTLKGRVKSTIIVNARKITCEEIEARLALCDGFAAMTIVAAPYREDDQVTDEIAIFFVDPNREELSIANVASLIVTTIAKHFRLSVKHVVPVAESDIERTATMKVKRGSLVRKYKRGRFANYATCAPHQRKPIDERAFLELWRQALDLPEYPRMDDSFFDLGGDSLAGARLISAVEAAFAIRIETDAFFGDPTPRRLLSLLRVQPARNGLILASGTADISEANRDVFRTVAAYVCSWKGERLFSDSLLIGFNTAGAEQPLFWVFQNYKEASALARAIGPNQPLYAMRSAVGIVPTSKYSEETLRGILDRYLWELLAVSNGKSFSLGGNCQGAIVAFFLANRLQAMGREPDRLFLMEWSFDNGRYQGPTEVLLGKDSHLWSGLDRAELASRLTTTFPRCSVHMIPGRHGDFFRPENVTHLALRLRCGSGRRWKGAIQACGTLLKRMLSPRVAAG